MKKNSLLVTLMSFVFLLPLNVLVAQELSRSEKAELLSNFKSEKSIKSTNRSQNPATSARRDRNRSYDGTNNNIRRGRQDWGSANSVLRRVLPANYSSADPKGGLNDDGRPSAREISNLVSDEPITQFTELELSATGYQWGQFIDHDISNIKDGDEEAPIDLPDDEPLFTEPIGFSRSGFEMVKNQREQVNLNSSYLDGSQVYGSNEERAKWLRTFSKGKLKTSQGNFLPYNTLNGELSGAIDPNAPSMQGDGSGTIKTFVAGDVRANENTVLLSFQTIFMREHNRICDLLVRVGYRNDEQIYQIARKYVGGIIQAITYNEFLPSLGIRLNNYRGYRSNKRADILNSFATASFRIGHTMVSDDVVVVNNDCEEIGPGEFDLIETFFNPELFVEFPIESWLKGSSVHELYQTDTKINDVLRNFLFGDPSSPVRFGIDLASVNIQRGRDHGIPDYNTLRERYTGRKARRFSDISSTDSVAQSLKALYGNINKIDAWVGILSEDLIRNKAVGRTMHNMMKEQFENLRDGDYYYYLNDPSISRRVKRVIYRTTLANIIERNTELTSMRRNVFLLDPCLPEEEELFAPESLVNLDLMSIGPVPTFDVLNVNFNSLEETPRELRVYSVAGRLIKTVKTDSETNSVEIATNNFSAGIYIIKLNEGDKTSVKKFVKQ